MKKLFLFAGCLISLGCGGGGGESSDCSTLGAKIFGGETCNQSSRSPVGDQGEIIRFSQIILHPGYNGERGGSPFDIAVASLSRVPSPAIGPIPLLVSEITGPGSEITAFGYGTNDEGTDSILKAESFVVSEARGGNLNVVGDGDTSICPGDSGGPAVYTTKSGTVALAGVNSYVNVGGLCSDAAADFFGFVDIQSPPVFDFIVSQVPDLAAG